MRKANSSFLLRRGRWTSAGRFMGGTEVRILTAYAGKLYAGNGYWEDRPGPEGPQRAQVLVLGGSGAHWRVDHSFDERMPSGRPRDLAVSALSAVGFATVATVRISDKMPPTGVEPTVTTDMMPTKRRPTIPAGFFERASLRGSEHPAKNPLRCLTEH